MTKKSILLIDDDQLFLMLTRKLLEKEPYLEHIDTVTTVEQAKAYFQQLEESSRPLPDAVFIDIDMPMINGLELASQLHDDFIQKQAGVKVYILSSSISQRDRQTAEDLKAVHGYMEKPLSPELLRKALELEKEAPESNQ